jgi:hypothetical protein
MIDLPALLTFGFIGTTLLCFLMLVFSLLNAEEVRIKKRAHLVALLLLTWLIFQSTLGLNKWYQDRLAVPPHMMFPIVVAILVMLILFVVPRGRRFIDGLSITSLTMMQVVRVPVELCLWGLAMNRQVPWSMTFEGRNFDILIGLSAPIIAIWGWKKGKLSKKVILGWNVLGMLLLLQVVVTGIGALPSPIQWWEFQQPNLAVMYFPFVWLPAFIVPAAAFSHVVSLRRLMQK